MLVDVPEPVRRHLEREVLAPALLAWLRIDPEGRVAEHDASDPSLDRRIQNDERVEDCLPMFVGMLPLEGRELSLRSVVFNERAPMDLHAFEDGEDTWVLLVDEGGRGEVLRKLLQRVNQEQLDRAQLNAVHDRLTEVARGLEVALFEPLGGSELRLVAAPPPWLTRVHPDLAVGDRLDARDISDYAADFLEAELRAGPTSTRLFDASLPWLEEIEGQGPLARECVLGTTTSGHSFFVVRRLGLDLADRTAPIQAGRDLGLLYERLAKEMEEKEILLHSIVHDLSNPLSNLITTLELLESSLTGDNEILRRTALGEALRQRSIINALLDTFRLERGQGRESTLERVDVREVLERLRPGMTFSAELREVGLKVVDEVGDPGLFVLGEPILLERILQNLLENAMRFSPAGTTITVTLSRGERRGHVSVDDEGPGVPEVARHEIFEKLRSGEAGAGRLGLGLHFCRITARRWGGDVHHTNRSPRGSRFELVLLEA